MLLTPRRGLIAAWVLALLVALSPLTPLAADTGPTGGKLLEPLRGMYHSAYPDFVGTEDRVSAARIRAFERLAGKPLAWVYFSDNWHDGIRFPAREVSAIQAAGRVPFVRLMARSTWRTGGPDPRYRLQRILAGRFDVELTEWFQAARDSGVPMLVEFGTEVDGVWFAWNGRWNGGGRTTGYGDPALADGPERFRDAYRHLVDLSRAAGADQLTWVFHVNDQSWPRRPWNTPQAYYPGDAYVDWIGVSVYGSQAPGEYQGSFRRLLDAAYPRLCALSADKPLAVLEWGIAQRPARGTKAGWIRDALRWLRSGRWPRIKAESYWHEDWPTRAGITNLRVDSSRAATRAYRRGVRSPLFTAVPRWSAAAAGQPVPSVLPASAARGSSIR